MISWTSIIPLIGGFPLGAQSALSNLPQYIVSYDCFNNNDKHILNHWKEYNIPYYCEVDHNKITPVDFAIMTPPCSALSSLNRKSSDEYQSIEWLFKASKIAMEKCQAKVIIGENAPGLVTKKGNSIVKKLHKLALEHNYSLSVVKIDSYHCGVPQKRLRSFFIFWKSDKSYIISKPDVSLVHTVDSYLKSVTLNEKFHNVEEETNRLKNNVQYRFIKEHLKMEISEFLEGGIFFITLIKKNMLDEYESFLEKNKLTRDLKFVKHIKKKMDDGKNYWDSQSLIDVNVRGYINALTGKTFSCFLHPSNERYLTKAELISLMGIPSNFEIDEKDLIHITQNVTTHSAKFITEQCIKFFTNDLQADDSNLFYQNLLIDDKIKERKSVNLDDIF